MKPDEPNEKARTNLFNLIFGLIVANELVWILAILFVVALLVVAAIHGVYLP